MASAQVGLGRDRVPGRSEPEFEGSASALQTNTEHWEVLSRSSDVGLTQFLAARSRDRAGAGAGRRAEGGREAGRQEAGRGSRRCDGAGVSGGREGGERRQV